MRKLLLVLFGLLCAPVLLAQQRCDERLAPSTPTAHFQFHGDGTVTHLRTGLRWTRCPIDTVWNDAGTPNDPADDRCDGTASRLTWGSALRRASAYARRHPAQTPWRLPNFKELASLVETACTAPAINRTAFPSVNGLFWSASPAPGQGVWTIDFNDATEQVYSRTVGQLPLLLVRDP